MIKLSNSKSTYLFFLLLMISQLISCAQKSKAISIKNDEIKKNNVNIIKTGADRTTLYIDRLKNKSIAIVANQTSILSVPQRSEVAPNIMGIKNVTLHLVDYLHRYKNIHIKKVFAPEHGFRGKADAGELIKDGIDTQTGLPVISLYGKNKKPSLNHLKGIDIVLFDIQDVGTRFYTYISSLHYVMEACAEAGIPVIILDRPNPNGHYIDGPVLKSNFKSFVGMHPVPVVYGMTIGEYGQMINGEKWMKDGIRCNLSVIPLKNYTHKDSYNLPIKPSPNLPNKIAINLYPSLCFFEGTNVSVGRGTNKQFQIYGSPYLNKTKFFFTPKPNEGAKYPKHENKICYGENLSQTPSMNQLNLSWLLKAYKQTSSVKTVFWNPFFTKLAGTEELQLQITKGFSEKDIRASWEEDLNAFKKVREKYLLYK